jgi:hypothetical protein
MNEKRLIDWERIELDYRAGILTLREIAQKGGVTEGAIRKRAKRDSWTRDLGEKIKARAADLVRKENVLSERVLIEAGAEVIATVKLSQKASIVRHRELADRLMAELEVLEDGDLAIRVDLAKKLSDTLKTLFALEREAFDITTPVKVEHTGSASGPLESGQVDLTKLSEEVLQALMDARID